MNTLFVPNSAFCGQITGYVSDIISDRKENLQRLDHRLNEKLI